MFGNTAPEIINQTLLQDSRSFFTHVDSDGSGRTTLKLGSENVKVCIPKSVSELLLEHFRSCPLNDRDIKAREMELLGWSYCYCKAEGKTLSAVDFDELPPEELLVPSFHLRKAMLGTSIDDLCKTRGEYELKKAPASMDSLTEKEKLELAAIKHFINDRRNLISSQNALGAKLREAYKSHHGSDMPHARIQFGTSIPLKKTHNKSRCLNAYENAKKQGVEGEFYRGQQHFTNADMEALLAKQLPDAGELLRSVLLEELKNQGYNCLCPIFSGNVPKDIGNAVALNDLFQELPASAYLEHGTYSHLYQIIAMTKAGIMTAQKLQKILRLDLWAYLIDQDSSVIADKRVYQPVDQTQGVFFNLSYVISAMPNSLYHSMSSGMDSRGIQNIVDEDNQERIAELGKLLKITPSSSEELKSTLHEWTLNLRALEVADIDSQYKATSRQATPQGRPVNKYFSTTRTFINNSADGEAVREYFRKGWHIYQQLENSNPPLELITDISQIPDISNGAYILYPPETAEVPKYLMPFITEPQGERCAENTCCIIL